MSSARHQQVQSIEEQGSGAENAGHLSSWQFRGFLRLPVPAMLSRVHRGCGDSDTFSDLPPGILVSRRLTRGTMLRRAR